MKRQDYLLFFVVGMMVSLGVSLFQSYPGYMDADYYYAIGLRIANGQGFSEPFLWNYLDNPSGLPHPSNAYWMPLTSLVVACFTKIWGKVDFKNVQLGFILLSSLIPPLTAHLAYTFSSQRWSGLLAGFLTIFSGFYLMYLSTTDAISILMILGIFFFVIIRKTLKSEQKTLPVFFFLLGITVGCIHLTRADGVLWLLLSCIYGFTYRKNNITDNQNLIYIIWIVCGYLCIMGPWMVRNLNVFGSVFAPGGIRTLFLSKYDQLFAFPPEELNFSQWWASGLDEIIRVRLWALNINFQNILAVEGMIFLLPLVMLGLWRLRNNPETRLGALAWLIIFSMMTFLLPFVGARGGLLHSVSVIQPLFIAAVPVGLNVCVAWGTRNRGWSEKSALRVFSVGLVVLAAFFSFLVVKEKVIGADRSLSQWDKETAAFIEQEEILQSLRISSNIIIMVNNPPGYYLSTDRPTIVIPYGDEKVLLAVAQKYGAGYVLIEENYAEGPIGDLYKNPGDRPGLEFFEKHGGVNFYRVVNEGG